jgi:hypothetical protein
MAEAVLTVAGHPVFAEVLSPGASWPPPLPSSSSSGSGQLERLERLAQLAAVGFAVVDEPEALATFLAAQCPTD